MRSTLEVLVVAASALLLTACPGNQKGPSGPPPEYEDPQPVTTTSATATATATATAPATASPTATEAPPAANPDAPAHPK